MARPGRPASPFISRFSDRVHLRDISNAAGDGARDDTTDIQNAFDQLEDGQSVSMTNGIWRTTAPLTVRHNISIHMDQGYILSDHDGVALEFNPSGRTDKRSSFGVNGYALVLDISVEKKINYWRSGSVGIKIINSLHGIINIHRLKGFSIGLLCAGGTVDNTYGGSSYNRIDLGKVDCCQRGVVLDASTDGSPGWCTENVIHGGSFIGFSGPPHTYGDACHVTIGGRDVVDSNKFICPSFEGTHVQALRFAARTIGNSVYMPRLEMPNAAAYFLFEEGTRDNAVTLSSAPRDWAAKIADRGSDNAVQRSAMTYSNGVIFHASPPGAGAPEQAGPFPFVPYSESGGGLAVVRPDEGVVRIDPARARFFEIDANMAIHTIDIPEIPALPNRGCGTTIDVEFVQPNTARGAAISGFPHAWKFNSNSSAPVPRRLGRDLYRLVRSRDGNWCVIGHYASPSLTETDRG